MTKVVIEYRNIEDINPYEKNPRKNDDAVRDVAESNKPVRYEIYAIVNRKNGKIYVGQTKQGYLVRYKQHMTSGGSPLFEKAIRKHGTDSFDCQLLDVAYGQKLANEKEKMWIKVLKSYISINGYNLSMGGEIGDFNEDTLKRMSEAKIGEKNSFYGKSHTEESKKKMSEWKKKHYVREKHPGAKKVRCVETGEVYDCVLDASESTGANPKHIGSVANKRYGRKTAGGYKWEWA